MLFPFAKDPGTAPEPKKTQKPSKTRAWKAGALRRHQWRSTFSSESHRGLKRIGDIGPQTRGQGVKYFCAPLALGSVRSGREPPGLAELDEGADQAVLEGVGAELPDGAAIQEDRKDVSLAGFRSYVARQGRNALDRPRLGEDPAAQRGVAEAVPEGSIALARCRHRGLPVRGLWMLVHRAKEVHQVRRRDPVRRRETGAVMEVVAGRVEADRREELLLG